MNATAELMTPEEMGAELGKRLRLARAAQGLRQEDLAAASGASLQAIKNLESGGKVELITFLRVAKALGMADPLMSACEPQESSLEELLRKDAARKESSRVRVKR